MRWTRYYETTHANVHRGVYAIAEEATRLYEDARRDASAASSAPPTPARDHLHQERHRGLNLVAHSWGRPLPPGNVVVLTEMEHHANIVPWLMLAEERGIELRYLPVDDDGRLDLSDLDDCWTAPGWWRCTAMSNVLGTINPLARSPRRPTPTGRVVLVDGAQLGAPPAGRRRPLGRRLPRPSPPTSARPDRAGRALGPGRLLDAMPPFLGGGGMILDVRLDRFPAAEVPQRFEAGTPPIAEAVGLAAAVDYLSALGMERVRSHERQLTAYALSALAERLAGDCTVFGPRPVTTGVGCSRWPIGTSTPTTWPRCSTSSACASGLATIAPSR